MTDNLDNNNNGKIDISELTLDVNGQVKKRRGGFVKGVSGNPKGRPKKVKLEDVVREKEVLDENLREACRTGEAKKVLEELLKTAENRTEAKQLSKELIQYQTPKKASIETKITDFRKIEFHMVVPEAMSQLESIYKADPKLVEQLSDDDIKKLTDNTFSIDNLNNVDPIAEETNSIVENTDE